MILLALIVFSATLVGAYNEASGASNRPLNFLEIINSVSDLQDIGYVTTDTFDRMLESFEVLSQIEEDFVKEHKDAINASFLGEPSIFLLDMVVRFGNLLWHIILLIFSVVVDLIRFIAGVAIFAYRLFFGVPA